MSACGPAAGRTLSKGYLSESPELVAAPALAGSGAGLGAGSAAGFAAGLAAAEVSGVEAAGVEGAGEGAVFAVGSAAAEVVGSEAAGFDAAGLAAAGFDAAGCEADEGVAFAAGLAAEVVGFAAAFGFAAALGFAAAFGFAAALGFAAAFGFAGALGLVGASAAAFDAVEAGLPAAFGFELGAAVPVGFAVADFGAPFAPALGAGFRFPAAGFRFEVPALAARSVRVVPGVEAPVLLPPARVPAGASVVVSGASSE